MVRTGVVVTVTAMLLGLTAAEAQAKYCDVQGSEEGLADLRVTNISCPEGRAVYRASNREAMKNPDAVPTRFQYGGGRWECRAKNPHREIDGQYVQYIWRCVSGYLVVRYRWLAGD